MSVAIDLHGAKALVTGGTRGIGIAIAQNFLAAGAQVVIASRKEEKVKAAVEQLGGADAGAFGCVANVGSPEDRTQLIGFCESTLGGLDILVNNAAANPVFGKVEATESWAFQKIMSVNVEAPFELAKLALPLLKRSEHASIINVSSIGGIRPEAQLGIYSVSKAALNSLTKVLAKEWGPYGIRVNSICPGLIQTDFSQALWSNDKLLSHMQHATPLARMGQPDEIGKLALAIVSGMGSYATGHVFVTDGGYTI